jgi:hypothetical protein
MAILAGPAPFRPPPLPGASDRVRNSSSASRASAVSEAVSTMASWFSPLSRVETIWVGITRKPPPKMYGALKDPSEVMKVRSPAPASAGLRCGSTTLRSVRHRPAPRLAAASSCDPSSETSAARTRR